MLFGSSYPHTLHTQNKQSYKSFSEDKKKEREIKKKISNWQQWSMKVKRKNHKNSRKKDI